MIALAEEFQARQDGDDCRTTDAHADGQITNRKLDLLLKSRDIGLGGDALMQCRVQCSCLRACLLLADTSGAQPVHIDEAIEKNLLCHAIYIAQKALLSNARGRV